MDTETYWAKRPRRIAPGWVIVYALLAVVAIAAVVLISNAPEGRPSPPVIDTQIESGRHLTFVLMAQQVAPGTEPYPPYVAQVKAARDSLRALAESEGIYYSTVGVATQWDIDEGQSVLNAYGHFDEVSLGRNWFNTGRLRYKGSTVPGVLVFLEDITVEQTSWTSLRLREVARFHGYRSMREWAARGFSLNLGMDIEAPDSAASLGPSDNSPAAPTDRAPVVLRSGNSAPAIWRLDSDVVASAGGTQADPLYRVVGAAVTEHHLIVAEASTGSLRFYTHAGTLEKTVGRQGEGPGEYRNMGWMHRVGDQIHAYDRPTRKVEAYSLDGFPVRSIAVTPHEELPGTSVVGAFADGSLLAIGSASPIYVPTEPETRRQPMTLVLHNPWGAPAHRLVDIVGPERYFEPWGRGGVQQLPRPFGRVTGVGVVDSVFLVMDNESHAISVYDRDGVQQGTLDPNPLPPLTLVRQSDIELVRGRLLADADERLGRFIEGMIRATGFPDHLPPYGWLALEPGARRPPLIVADGLVFALRYGGIESTAGEVAAPEWLVFRPDEGHVATLTSPDDVRLLDLAGNLVAVLRKTELGEEVVELRRVHGRE